MRITTFRSGKTAEQAREHLFKYLKQVSLVAPKTTVMPDILAPVKGKETIISLVADGAAETVVKARRENPNAKIAVLNFSSFKHPGGGFMTDMLAQEESLCYCSNLYWELNKHRNDFYAVNSSMLNSGLYADRAMLSENISFVASAPENYLPNKEICTADVITCAAPNLNYMMRRGRHWDKEVLQAVRDRIRYVNSILAGRNYDIVIYGAYGCGVFRNDPDFVARCFKWDLQQNYPNSFSRVIFAIPDKSSKNYLAFKGVLFE